MLNQYSKIFLAVFSLMLFGCGKNNTPTDNFDKKGMFANYANNLIIPAYENYMNALNNLKTAVEDFNATPELSTLSIIQDSFIHAYTQWQYVEIYDKTLPADDVQLLMNSNYYPCRPDSINAYIARGENSVDVVKNKSKNDKGLAAIEYLLFSRTLSQQDILNSFTTDVNAASRRAYLTALVSNLINLQTTVLNQWSSYKNEFSSNLSTNASSPFSTLVNSIAQRTDDFKRHQVGMPAGYQGNVATIYTKPKTVQAYYSNNSILFMLTMLHNMEDVFYGKNGANDGLGLYDYLKTLNYTSTFGGDLADDIMVQIQTCINKVNDCGIDYSNTITTDKPKADALFNESKKLLILMKVDVPSALGVSISYTDADGD